MIELTFQDTNPVSKSHKIRFDSSSLLMVRRTLPSEPLLSLLTTYSIQTAISIISASATDMGCDVVMSPDIKS